MAFDKLAACSAERKSSILKPTRAKSFICAWIVQRFGLPTIYAGTAPSAEGASNEPTRQRYRRMEAAWRALADEQDWLDGEASPDRKSEQ